MQTEACQGGWREGRVLDSCMLILDWRGGEDRVRRTCARRVCEGDGMRGGTSPVAGYYQTGWRVLGRGRSGVDAAWL